jgi:hypothetical protein
MGRIARHLMGGLTSSTSQAVSLLPNGFLELLACCCADFKTTNEFRPVVCCLQHLVQSPTCPSAVKPTSLGQHEQVLAANGFAFATKVHWVFTPWPFAEGEVKAGRQVPVPLHIHAVSEVFWMVVAVVVQHIEHSSFKSFLHQINFVCYRIGAIFSGLWSLELSCFSKITLIKESIWISLYGRPHSKVDRQNT